MLDFRIINSLFLILIINFSNATFIITNDEGSGGSAQFNLQKSFQLPSIPVVQPFPRLQQQIEPQPRPALQLPSIVNPLQLKQQKLNLLNSFSRSLPQPQFGLANLFGSDSDTRTNSLPLNFQLNRPLFNARLPQQWPSLPILPGSLPLFQNLRPLSPPSALSVSSLQTSQDQLEEDDLLPSPLPLKASKLLTPLHPSPQITPQIRQFVHPGQTSNCNCDHYENLEVETLKHNPAKALSVLGYHIEHEPEKVEAPCGGGRYSYGIEQLKPKKSSHLGVLQGHIDRVVEPNTDCCAEDSERLIFS